MKLLRINLFLAIMMAIACVGCSDNTSAQKSYTELSESSEQSNNKVSDSPSQIEALRAAQSFVRDKFASDAKFKPEGVSVKETDVPGRFKIMQRFHSKSHDAYNMVYRIWVQKFDHGWEFGNLGIEYAGGDKALDINGRMKDLERQQGVGESLTAGGVTFTIAEQNGKTFIRIFTDKKLSRDQLRAAIVDLIPKYEQIQFATVARHERGDEYASWNAGMFFDFDKNEIISKEKFLP